MIMYYLYKKEHNVTRKKYLGSTTREDYDIYRGSGKIWKRHIKKHDYDVTTEIIAKCGTLEELQTCGLFWSEVWDVVNSLEWANLREEAGNGWSGPRGPMSEEHKDKHRHPYGPQKNPRKRGTCGKRGPHKNPNTKPNWCKGLKRGPMSEEHKDKISKGVIKSKGDKYRK